MAVLRPRRPLSRWIRLCVAILVVIALLPGAAELVEALAHLAHEGHLAHAEAHADDADDEAEAGCDTGCDEQGCSALAHHCGCCPSLPALAAADPSPARRAEAPDAGAPLPARVRGPPARFVPPGLRPPIA